MDLLIRADSCSIWYDSARSCAPPPSGETRRLDLLIAAVFSLLLPLQAQLARGALGELDLQTGTKFSKRCNTRGPGRWVILNRMQGGPGGRLGPSGATGFNDSAVL